MANGSVLEAIGGTPLVELEGLRTEEGPRIFAKWEGSNPTGSMKDRMAVAMIEGATRTGRLEPGQGVVEYTGGSTGSSLALVCAVKGHPLHIVTADCFSQEKIRTMRALGAQVEVIETPEGRVHPGLLEQFKKRVKDHVDQGAYWTAQMESPHQMDGYKGLAREILLDCPDVTDFVMCVGTAGCAMGTSKGFREYGSDVRVHLVEPAECTYLSTGEGGSHQVEGIAVNPRPPLLDEGLFDDVVVVPEEEGRKAARRLAHTQGLLTGTSSGLNIAASIQIAKSLPEDANIVTIAVDSGLKYLGGNLFFP